MSGPLHGLRIAVRRVVDPVLAATLPGFAHRRHRRTWDGLARTQTRAVTAPFEPPGEESYWASGVRDLGLLLDVAGEAGPLGKELAVDLGCGIGRLLKPLAARFERVVAVDISREMLEQARANVGDANARYVLAGPGCEIDVPDASADLVIAWTVFRHTPKAVFAAYAREARRVLRPGGRFVFEAQVREQGPIEEPPDFQPVTEREYRWDELEAYCRDSGFSWAADRTAPSATPSTSTLIMAWQR